jgi:hypothetical protein
MKGVAGLMQSNNKLNLDVQVVARLAANKPQWQRPVTTILEIDEVTLTGGDGNSEGAFSHS